MKDKDITASFGGPSELVFWSFRYFLGRMTGAACTFANSLSIEWPNLTPHVQKLIQRELEEEFRKDDEMRARPHSDELRWLPLGNDCDRAAWEKVRSAYKEGAA